MNIAAQIPGFITGLVTAFVLFVLRKAYENKNYLKLFIKTRFMYKKRIRFSIAYLFTILIDGKYLLIKGSRIEQYQPIGGVYKMKESFDNKFDILNDDLIPIDNNSESDLRVRVKGSQAVKFIKWFKSNKNREISVHREFYEELIQIGYLSEDSLKQFNPEFIDRINTGVNWSDYANSDEILIYEIYKIKLSESEKQQILEAVKSTQNLILVPSVDIESNHTEVDGKLIRIGKHSKHIL